ncbi:MAG: heavy metal translocating P-type ATPase [bacterium]|nr:heavy metal translocating P-type ATPase [bacterium]
MHAHAPVEGLDKHAGHHTEDFLRKFWVVAALSVPVILYSPILDTLFGWSAPAFPGSAYLPLALGSIVFFYGGLVFLNGARRELAARVPGMMTLIALAITTAYFWSVYAAFVGEEPLWWELSTLIAIMLLGHWIEMRAVSGAAGALRALSKLLPDMATVRRDGRTATVPLRDLREGDLMLVAPGAKIPADGVVTEGESEADESMITGESKPVEKHPASQVIAGTINGDGSLEVTVTHIGETTFLAGVMRLVAEAQASKSKLQILSDRAAFYLTIIATLAGAATLAAWLLAGEGASFAVSRLVAVLVIACPHALGLAVPLVAAISTTKAAKSGFLVRKRIALEAARTIDTVLFDKTGTLTRGVFGITGVWAVAGESEEVVLAHAAALDALSSHPVAKAVVEAAHARSLSLVEATGHTALKGRGAKAVLDGKEVMVGSSALLAAYAFAVPPELAEHVAEAGRAGQTVIFVVEEGRVRGALALADIVREESRAAIAMLRSMGIRSVMITGDSEDVARAVVAHIGLDEYFARVLPEEKSAKVRLLQEAGHKVAMVGDGINDAPALAQADLGIAIGAGTNVAIESAGIVLVRDDPRDIPKIIRLSRLTYTKMLQNLWWAAGYNIVAIPLAGGVLAAWGIFLEPAASAILMSASTVVVAVNAMLLARRPLA